MPHYNPIKNKTFLKNRRKILRAQLTPAEAQLWKLLKNKNLLGLKFRRQYSIENYIVDFCCPSQHIIIELDGEIHRNSVQSDYDFIRDQRLGELNYKVLRFENADVFRNPDAIIESVREITNKKN